MPLGKLLDEQDRRATARLETLTLVRVESVDFGDTVCVARNISSDGIFLEMRDPLPLGTPIRILFSAPIGATRLVMLGEVKNHYFLHYNAADSIRSLTGMGVRFTGAEGHANEWLVRHMHQPLIQH